MTRDAYSHEVISCGFWPGGGPVAYPAYYAYAYPEPEGFAQARVEPIYETIPGWREKTAHARSWADLPAQAIKYVRRLEELIGCPAAILSTSPEREDTILMQNPFET